jgi:hypothetical protein
MYPAFRWRWFLWPRCVPRVPVLTSRTAVKATVLYQNSGTPF